MLDWAPWIWIALAVALAAAEMVVPSFLLIWPAAAALIVGLVVFAVPGLALSVQMSLFAACAVLLTLVGRRYLMTHRPAPQHHPALNQRAQRLVGLNAVADGAFEGGRGAVIVEGERWTAHAVTPVADNGEVTITGVDGMVLEVVPR